MTQFAQNLAALRKRAGYTQETLAEALGGLPAGGGKVGIGPGLPEASTLLTLADLLGCSLDQLMRQPLEDETVEAAGSEPDAADNPAADWAVFVQHMNRFAFQIALGVVLVLVGVALTVAAAAFFPRLRRGGPAPPGTGGLRGIQLCVCRAGPRQFPAGLPHPTALPLP